MKTLPHPLHRAMPIVAAALGRKFGVDVRVGGDEAKTDGRTIVIPALPADSALLPVAWGYLAHEAAHVRHTDFAVYATAARQGDALSAQILNILEDVRIERALAGPYPGTRETLQAVCKHLLAEGGINAPSADAHPARILTGYLLLALRHRVLGYAVLAEEARRAEAVLRAVFPTRTIHRLQGLLTEVGRLRSTAEAVELTQRLRALLETEQQAQPPETATRDASGKADEKDDAAGQAPAPQPSQSSADGSRRSSAQAAPPQTSDIGAEQKDASNRGQPDADQTAGDDAPLYPSGRPCPASAGQTPPQDDGKPDASVPKASNREDAPAKRDALRQALSSTGDGLLGDVFTAVRDLLAAAGTGSSRCVLPNGERFIGDAEAGTRLLSGVQQTSRALIARLHGLVQAARRDRPHARRAGPRLLPKRLYRAAIGDPRVFARKRARVAVDTALHLLIDLSASMGAPVRVDATGDVKRRSEIALESALAFSLALDAINGVSVAVSAFPGRSGEGDAVTVMVRHGERPRAHAGAFIQQPRGSTPMAGALWFAAADLLARPESRRIILVLTDGKPDALADTRDILRLCQAAEIEMLGLGIAVDVSALFPVALRVGDVTELKSALFGAAERLFIAA